MSQVIETGYLSPARAAELIGGEMTAHDIYALVRAGMLTGYYPDGRGQGRRFLLAEAEVREKKADILRLRAKRKRGKG